jgi:hypothetical protein
MKLYGMSFGKPMPAGAAQLLAVTDQCHRIAAANISPVQALAELKRAIDLLQPVILGSLKRCSLFQDHGARSREQLLLGHSLSITASLARF